MGQDRKASTPLIDPGAELADLALLHAPAPILNPLGFDGGGFDVFCGVNGLEHGGDFMHLRRRHMAENVAVPVNHAALPADIQEELVNPFDQTRAGVGDGQLDALQVFEEVAPARSVLLGVRAGFQNLAATVGADANRHQQRGVAAVSGPAAQRTRVLSRVSYTTSQNTAVSRYAQTSATSVPGHFPKLS